MVPPVSDRVSPAPPYSGFQSQLNLYAYRTITFSGYVFQNIFDFGFNQLYWSYNPGQAVT